MAAALSITQSQLFTQLRALFLLLVPAGTEVVRGQDNGVPMPEGPFVLITQRSGTQLATPVQSYDSVAQLMSVSQSTEYRIDVDCYGVLSCETARVLVMALRTSYACEQLQDLAPLFATDAVQFPLVNGEERYEERWRFESVLQYTPSFSVPQQSATQIAVGIISVDPTYTP